MQKQSTLADDTGAARAELEASRAQSGTLAAETDTLEKQLEEAQRAMERLGESRAERGALVAKLDQDRVRIESRLSTLREMIEARAGFDESVREVLAAREAGSPDFAGVLGPLADMIEAHAGADTDAAAAVEAALGADLQGLVVRAVADLPGHEQARAIKGRVTFLPCGAWAMAKGSCAQRGARRRLESAGRAPRDRSFGAGGVAAITGPGPGPMAGRR